MQIKVKLYLALLAMLFPLSFGLNASAETIFSDNFNGYDLGDITGKGGWLAANYRVTDSSANEGNKSVIGRNSIAGGSGGAIKSGNSVNTGKITFYVRRFDSNQPGVFSFKLAEGSQTKIEVRGNWYTGDVFQYINGQTASYVGFGERFFQSQWYGVQIQWRSSDYSARYNINGGTWTEWARAIAPWTNGLDTVSLTNYNAIAWDTIQENLVGQKNPVLIVPGIMASRLYEGGNRFWEPLSDSDVEALYLDEEGKSVRDDVMPESVIGTFDGPLIFNRKVYDALLADLEKMKSENVSFDYAAAPYDWRLSIPDILEEGSIEQALNDLYSAGGEKVTIVAHSNGGLVVEKLNNKT